MWELMENEQLGPVTKSLLLVCGLFILAFFLESRKRLLKILRLPGPVPVPFLGNLLYIFANGYNITALLKRGAKDYNGFLCVWGGSTPIVILTDPQHLKTFYTSTSMIDRSDQYKYTYDFFGPSLFVVGGSQWKKLRKMFIMNFNNSTPAETLKTNFILGANELVKELKTRVNGPAFQSNDLLTYITANNIFRNSVGESLPEEHRDHLLHAVDFLMRTVYMRNFSITQWYDFTFNLYADGRKFWREAEYFNDFFQKLVLKKRAEFQGMKERGEAIPNLYIYNILQNHGNEPLDLLVGELKTLMVTGLDTTAGTLGFTLSMLGLFPEVQEKVYQEDLEVQKRLEGRELEVDDLQHYPYLDRVLKETLRLFPVAGTIARKLNTDTYFGKHLVPAGTDVVALQVYTNHSKKYFPDPFKFDPDRFLPENKLAPYTYNAFSAGHRICPGMKYAYMALKITIPALVREFIIKSDYSSLDEVLNNVDTTFTLKDKQNHRIRLEARTC